VEIVERLLEIRNLEANNARQLQEFNKKFAEKIFPNREQDDKREKFKKYCKIRYYRQLKQQGEEGNEGEEEEMDSDDDSLDDMDEDDEDYDDDIDNQEREEFKVLYESPGENSIIGRLFNAIWQQEHVSVCVKLVDACLELEGKS